MKNKPTPKLATTPEWFPNLLATFQFAYKPLGVYLPTYKNPIPIMQFINQITIFITMEKLPVVIKKKQANLITVFGPIIKKNNEWKSEVLFHSAWSCKNIDLDEVNFKFYY